MLCRVSLEDVEQALMQILLDKGWAMDEQHRKPWATSTAAKFRCQARHVQQARLKGARWAMASLCIYTYVYIYICMCIYL